MTDTRLRVILAGAAVAMMLSGCAMAKAPVTGFLYSDIKAPLMVTPRTKWTREGRATVTSYVGLVALGDASVEAAMKNGGLTTLHHVDIEVKSYAGVYTTYTTVVYGE